ncbi:hypothetical protein ACPC54_03600 [Kitasatospora sp. NPDC094028]
MTGRASCGASSGAAPALSGGSPVAVVKAQLAAAERCETLLEDTLDAIDPAPAWRSSAPVAGVRLPRPGRESGACWYVGRGRDLLTVVSLHRRAELVGVVERYWRRRGWTITSRNAVQEAPGVAAATRDGYQLAFRFGDLGQARLAAGSSGAACAEHGPAVLPEARCSYWSSMG